MITYSSKNGHSAGVLPVSFRLLLALSDVLEWTSAPAGLMQVRTCDIGVLSP